MSSKITRGHLERGAVIYVRQSTPLQVREHTEGRRNQYDLVEHARALGFASVAVIDDDLGRSGSGLEARPGFERLVTKVCSASIGAIFCLEASRLARNGRDWHHLLDLCALVGVLLFDPEGAYEPRLMNDRLLLGLKGTMSEYELGLLRQRSLQARDTKAARGQLRYQLAPRYVWGVGGRIEKDPDARVAEAIELIFKKFAELGSVRQTWLWFCDEALYLPVIGRTEQGTAVLWKPARYHNILTLLSNPIYAGAYAFGKTGQRTHVVDGRARRTDGHQKPMGEWSVLIRDNHEGYISWEQFLVHRSMIAENAHMKKRAARKSGRGGRALLSGMIRCRRCGYMMRIAYASKAASCHRYFCRSRDFTTPAQPCIAVGGVRLDKAVAAQMLEALTPKAIEAATLSVSRRVQQAEDARAAIERELEEARYEARLAARRYEAVDPDKRLVARQLEERWETALQRVAALEGRLRSIEDERATTTVPNIDELRDLAQRLPVIWNAPTTDMKVKQRIAGILIKEVVVDVDEHGSEAVALIHWRGGRHTELRIHRNRRSIQQGTPKPDAPSIVAKMAGRYTDGEIALTLNRARRGQHASGGTWSERRVRDLRLNMGLADYDPSRPRATMLTRDEVAERLGICVGSVMRLITDEVLPAEQAAPFAPWQIPEAALDDEQVSAGVQEIRERRPKNLEYYQHRSSLPLPEKD